ATQRRKSATWRPTASAGSSGSARIASASQDAAAWAAERSRRYRRDRERQREAFIVVNPVGNGRQPRPRARARGVTRASARRAGDLTLPRPAPAAQHGVSDRTRQSSSADLAHGLGRLSRIVLRVQAGHVHRTMTEDDARRVPAELLDEGGGGRVPELVA